MSENMDEQKKSILKILIGKIGSILKTTWNIITYNCNIFVMGYE